MRGVGIGFADFSHNAVGSDDAHVAADAVVLTAIEIEGLRGRVGAGGDDTRGKHRNRLVVLPEVEKFCEAIGFVGLVLELVELKLEIGVFAGEALVVAGGVLQSEVVIPDAANAADAAGADTFEGRDRAHGPDTNQASL